MAGLFGLSFAAPWALAALLVLPGLWWLLRVTPPSPRRISFPAIALLRDLDPKEQTSAHTPLWLILLRLLVATALILALAGPVLNPQAPLAGRGPILLILDNGWSAAPGWDERIAAADALLARAERETRPVALATTASSIAGEPVGLIGPMNAGEIRTRLDGLAPQPWPGDRTALAERIKTLPADEFDHIVWFSDGITSQADPDDALAAAITRFASAERHRLDTAGSVMAITGFAAGGTPTVQLSRPGGGPQAAARSVRVQAVNREGHPLGFGEAEFAAGGTTAEAVLEGPPDLLAAVDRLSLASAGSAGSVFLVDDRRRRRPVGIVAGEQDAETQPLLADSYYIERALAPFADLRSDTLSAFMEAPPAVLILSDIGSFDPAHREWLAGWVEGGGTLIRFAGPRLIEGLSPGATQDQSLLPVRLRGRDRNLGGALSWSEPARLGEFSEAGPFAGLPITEDVTIRRQVLAEPTIDLPGKSWARLADGTPLVTGAAKGGGWLVLIHTTANSDWSDLPLSGLFVEMLRRLVGLSAGIADPETAGNLPPLSLLDGFGRLTEPPALVEPIAAASLIDGALAPGPDTPPGFYGRADDRRAINLGPAIGGLSIITGGPRALTEIIIGKDSELALKPALLTAALLLFLADLIATLAMRGLMPTGLLRRALPALLLVAVMPLPALADPLERAAEAANDTWLAYVVTGDSEADAISRDGLEGLAAMLRARTSIEAAGAMGVRPGIDELAFFALLYWPITDSQSALGPGAISALNRYMRAGGVIVFDTSDQRFGGGSRAPGEASLQRLAQGLDIPPLTRVPVGHVLTKSFYLLQDFPGAYAGGDVWVAADEAETRDGVSSIVVTPNDWARAWAVDAVGQPLYPVSPGGERQREMAWRTGINLAMYALTGNYKADQVHVPHILDRLGQ